MWVNPITKQVFKLHSDIRFELYEQGKQLPAILNDEILAANGYPKLTQIIPAYDPITHGVFAHEPELNAEGQWIEQWEVVMLPPEAIAANRAMAEQTFKEEVVAATQFRLDAFARTRNYDGILSACTYASSTINKFMVEGQYCVNMRDATWMVLYSLMADVQAGNQPMPATVEDVLAVLPVLEWPV